ncbi:hypothetical protein HX071_09970 [Myroides marinus]|uniref:hypothetical protein n=1 Tax=Myroides marinus TaxID=703342 RepID=UPI002577900F|nr:hypothetical protein [Myroides marinus]MDM1502518.1 hypothetical protein [Myroides marinus]
MKKTYIGFAGLSLLLLLGTQTVHAQQGFGTDKPHRSAAVEIQSSKRGLLIPRVDLVETTNGVTPINAPEKSLMVYNQATTSKGTTTDVTPGYYYWDGAKWVRFAYQSEITEITLAGDVTGKTGDTKVVALQGTSISNVVPTANQVLTFDAMEGKWKPISLTETNLTSSKGITGTGITVGGETNGAGSVLKDVTLSIAHGGANQVMVTNADGNGTTWVDQSTIAPATTHTVEKDVTGNKLTSNVNGEVASVDLVDNVTNTVTGSSIVTTVNGVASTSVDLKDAIQTGQKITTVADGINTKVTSSVNPEGSNTTEYKVNVSNEAIQAAQKLTTVSQGAGVKVTPKTEEGSNTTDYNVAINTDGGNAGDVLTVVPPKEGTTTPSVEWKTPNYENIYTHDGTLVSTETNFFKRTVDFGTFNSLMFKKGNQSHDFTYDNTHAGLNIRGNNTASIGLLSEGSTLKVEHNKDESLIQSNAEHGIKIVAENTKDINFGTSGRTDNDNVVFQGNGGVKVVNINKPEFKGEATDKIVVADTNGVLKTVDRKKVAPQFFYMPAVIFNTKTQGTGLKRDLYQDYVNQFTGGKVGPGNANYNISHGAPGSSVLEYTGGIVGSEEAPVDIAVFEKGELHYYVTYYDTKVFKNLSISKEGVLTYDIIGTATPASYMNIVFVIK